VGGAWRVLDARVSFSFRIKCAELDDLDVVRVRDVQVRTSAYLVQEIVDVLVRLDVNAQERCVVRVRNFQAAAFRDRNSATVDLAMV